MSLDHTSSGSSLPLRSALKSEDDVDRTPPGSGTLKAVHIAEPEVDLQNDDDALHGPKMFRVGSSKRLSGKFAPSFRSSAENSPAFRPVDDSSSRTRHQDDRRQYYSEKMLAQVSEWLDHERRKASQRSKKPHHRQRKSISPPKEPNSADPPSPTTKYRPRSDSVDSQESDMALDKLQQILEDTVAHMGLSSIPHFPSKVPRHKMRRRGSLRAASSDTDYVDGDAIVPSCDAWLDNTLTIKYAGSSKSNEAPEEAAIRTQKEKDAWLTFKNEIIRIAHTLRLKGWRRVSLDAGASIYVERLSGALTNAVYVVNPPPNLPDEEGKKMPPKILLRIYGPQVEHLIDRENELQVLQRLARKKIGPRLLGTFKNGRFEQFFNAITLVPSDLREPDTSKQIAKRMRELHDGVDLLYHERENGPGVWRNWDQWLENVDRIVTYLDQNYEAGMEGVVVHNPVAHNWKANGYVCGLPWKKFLEVVEKYRVHMNAFYKNKKSITERLVFAHNDTQYGNILRIKPDDERSPLLQPANKHKQLVVIDFEYAAANTAGLEFANHFSEWTYNYHDPVTSHVCNHTWYPNPDEQRRFIKAYVDHRPQFPQASSTPRMAAQDSNSSSAGTTPILNAVPSSSSIVDFMLDARAPPGGWGAAERAREEQTDQQVCELMDETRLWRPVNSAMWVAWGVVQAKIPGLDDNKMPVSPEEAVKAEEQLGMDEFDYLSYAQSRAMFFWGDCVSMGFVKLEELPQAVQDNIKIVDY